MMVIALSFKAKSASGGAFDLTCASQVKAKEKLPVKDPLPTAEIVRVVESQKRGERQLATAKTLHQICFSLAALAFLAGQLVGQTMQHERAVTSAQFSPDGRWVVTASKDYTARVWDATTGRAVGEPMKHGGVVHSAQFSPDGRRVVTASEDNTARLWDVSTR
jgi:hypothetical protein